MKNFMDYLEVEINFTQGQLDNWDGTDENLRIVTKAFLNGLIHAKKIFEMTNTTKQRSRSMDDLGAGSGPW